MIRVVTLESTGKSHMLIGSALIFTYAQYGGIVQAALLDAMVYVLEHGGNLSANADEIIVHIGG
jgi:hypothetical protein